jgi:hypothetical protein
MGFYAQIPEMLDRLPAGRRVSWKVSQSSEYVGDVQRFLLGREFKSTSQIVLGNDPLIS